jgi:hypothetical protein
MDVSIERCAGSDVHRNTVVATARRPGRGGVRRSQTPMSATMTAGGRGGGSAGSGERDAGRDGIDRGPWKPVSRVLEDRFPVWVINAEHLRDASGRKTDVVDSTWVAQLLAHGSVPRVPCHRAQSGLSRHLMPHGRRSTEERTRTIQRREKALQDVGPHRRGRAGRDRVSYRRTPGAVGGGPARATTPPVGGVRPDRPGTVPCGCGSRRPEPPGPPHGRRVRTWPRTMRRSAAGAAPRRRSARLATTF